MPTSYTDAQREAIFTHDRNLIVTAGAGSGKTRVLVDRFIALLDAHPEWPLAALVAITFTEKAAREMRDRVRQGIEARVEATESAGQHDHARLWRARMAALDSARIGTIHSLCGIILRANAAEVGIDPRFTVLDEVESAILAEEAIESTLAELTESESGRLLIEYGSGAVRGVLRDRIAMPENWFSYLELDYATVQARYTEHAAAVIDRVVNDMTFRSWLAWQPEKWPESDKLLVYWDMIRAEKDTLDSGEPAKIYDLLSRWSVEIKLNVGAAKAWGGKEMLQEAKDTLKAIREYGDGITTEIGEPPNEDDAHASVLFPLWADAIRRVRANYQTLKGNDRLDFDDLETKTCALLTNPKVVARYRDAEFKHLLVDEFQDTNEAQRQIVYALAGLDRPGGLFVVGDPKQSIYQFRGADVSVFSRVRDDILRGGGREIALNESFRTHRDLVAGFNTIFGRLLTRGSGPMARYEVEYDPMIAGRDAPADPAIEIILIAKAQENSERLTADDLRRWEAYQLTQSLIAMIDHAPIWDRRTNGVRTVQYSDIAILFQARTGMGVVEEMLKAAGIPYVTLAGYGYYNQPEIWDLHNLLRALYNPADNLALATALHSPLFNLSDNDLLRLRLDPSRSLWDALLDPDQEVPIKMAGEILSRLHMSAGRVTIAELLMNALDATGYLATVLGLPGGERRAANIEKFLELARASGRIGLGAFTAFLRDLTDREVREGEAPIETGNAVRLMTVHASKGLEFPVVALFDAAWTGREHHAPLIIDGDSTIGAGVSLRDENGEVIETFLYRRVRELLKQREAAEKLRLLYVGMTRAQDYLIVTGHVNKLEEIKGRHWIAQLLTAMELTAPSHGEKAQPWGTIQLTIPETPPSEDGIGVREEHRSSWDALDEAFDDAEIPPYAPPLMAPLTIDRLAPARSLTATMLAHLGSSKAIPDLARFRYHVLREAPVYVSRVESSDEQRVRKRAIGEMVHRALQWGRLPGENPDALRQILSTYGWQLGITDELALKEAVTEAINLLRKTERDDITRIIASAIEVYRELPFVFKYRGERTITGIIDVLVRFEDSSWAVVDYKTSYVKRAHKALRDDLELHAVRYYAQVGIYAAAVESLIGSVPTTYIHYIRYAETLHILQRVWQSALDALEDDIQAALRDPADAG
jgi:ATP-dependent helicase/nuclease subunit A